VSGKGDERIVRETVGSQPEKLSYDREYQNLIGGESRMEIYLSVERQSQLFLISEDQARHQVFDVPLKTFDFPQTDLLTIRFLIFLSIVSSSLDVFF